MSERRKTIRIPDGPGEQRKPWAEPLVAVAGVVDDRPKPGLYQVGKDELGRPVYVPLGFGPRWRIPWS